MSLRDELERVRRQSQLTAANVVRAAEQDRAEYPHIYSRLEWDNDVAGPKYREVQAAELIRSVTVIRTIDSEPKEIRQYVSVAREDGRSYEPVEKVADDPVLREIVLRDMEREWRALFNKYGGVKEFFEMIDRDRQRAA